MLFSCKQHYCTFFTSKYDQSNGVIEIYTATKFCDLIWFCFQDMSVESEEEQEQEELREEEEDISPSYIYIYIIIVLFIHLWQHRVRRKDFATTYIQNMFYKPKILLMTN